MKLTTGPLRAGLGLLVLECLSIAVHAEDHTATKTRAGLKADDFELRISSVVRAEVKPGDVYAIPEMASQVVGKWVVTTELTNNSKTARLLSAVPYYSGTVRGQIEKHAFMSGSRLPIRSKDLDFVLVPPAGMLRATHIVLAIREKTGGKFTLYGFFDGNENVPDPSNGNWFRIEWHLIETPVGNELEFSMTLAGPLRDRTREVLGDDYKKLWRGQIMSKPAKLTIVADP